MNDVIGSVLSLLNNKSLLRDPYNGNRVGNFFFDQDHQMNLRKYMPKGQVTDDNKKADMVSFGQSRKLNLPTVNVYFWTLEGDKDSTTNLKNSKLVYHYLEKIEDIINYNLDMMGNFKIKEFGKTIPPKYDKFNKVYWGVKPITFQRLRI